MFGESSVLTQNHCTNSQNIPMCSFSVGQGFHCTKFKNFRVRQSKRVNFSRFVQISIESGTNMLAYGLHANIVRTSVRTKNLEKTSRANTRETCEHPCEQKSLKKQVVRTSCERREHLIQIPLLAEISPKKSPILPKNLHIHIADRKLHSFAQKT